MKLLSVIAVLAAGMLVTSCASLDKRMTQAAVDLGVSQAKVNLPDRPEDCSKTEPHAVMKEGDEVRSVLKRERAALDRQNARTIRCEGVGGFYENVWTSY